jgi:hypothetical protein
MTLEAIMTELEQYSDEQTKKNAYATWCQRTFFRSESC